MQGTLSAGSEPEARNLLERKGLLVEFVGEAAVAVPTAAVVSTPQPVADAPVGWNQALLAKYEPESLNHLYRQVVAMLKAGVPLVTALTTLSGGAYSPRIRSALGEIKDAVHRGDPISSVVEKRKDVFPSLHASVLKAAERGGFVDTALESLSGYLVREIKLRNAWKKRTFYPKLLLAITFIIILSANAVIAWAAARSGGVAMYLNNFLLNPLVGGPIVLIGIAVVVFLRIARTSYKAARLRDAIAFWIPHYASTAQMLAMAKFSRALALLFGAGVPVRDAVLLSSDAAGNLLISESVRPLVARLNDGASIWDALKDSNMFTETALDMIRAGEQSGSLQSLLEHLAHHYEEEGDVRMEKFTTVLTTGVLILVLLAVASTIFGFWTGYSSQLSSYME